MSFEEWFQSTGCHHDYKGAAHIAWLAALTEAQRICRELDEKWQHELDISTMPTTDDCADAIGKAKV